MVDKYVFESEIINLNKELEIVNLVINKKRLNGLDSIEIRGAALSLATLYNGIERVLVLILIDKSGPLKENSKWHVELLKKAVEAGIISHDLYNELKKFLGFRHFIRHAYSFEINPATIEAVLDVTPGLTTTFIGEIRDYLEKKER